jgi:nicotinamide-nucleotide amidase
MLKTENFLSFPDKHPNHPPVRVAELLSVGTELLFGEIVDTNSAYLSQELKNRGVYIYWKSTVGDNQIRVVEAIRRALSRSDLVILGGGLGPTDDDLTRESIAEVVGETPVID